MVLAESSPGWDRSGGVLLFRRKKNQRLNTVPYRPRRKSAFQLSVRASVHTMFAHVHGGNFSLTANTPVNSVGSLTRKADRARDTVIKFRTTVPRSVKNLLLRPERGCKKKRSLNNDPSHPRIVDRIENAPKHPGINTRECIFQSYAKRYLFLVRHRERRFVCIKAMCRRPSAADAQNTQKYIYFLYIRNARNSI